MKNIIFSFCLLLMFSCSQDRTEQPVVAPEGMHALNLKKYGKAFTIFIPDTTKARLEISEQPSGSLEIKVGRDYGVSISEQEADITMKKQDLKDDEVNKLTKMITDEPDAVMWESSIVNPEFHFLVNKKAGSSSYSFEDIKDPSGFIYSSEAVKRMFESCRNIQPATKNQ